MMLTSWGLFSEFDRFLDIEADDFAFVAQVDFAVGHRGHGPAAAGPPSPSQIKDSAARVQAKVDQKRNVF